MKLTKKPKEMWSLAYLVSPESHYTALKVIYNEGSALIMLQTPSQSPLTMLENPVAPRAPTYNTLSNKSILIP